MEILFIFLFIGFIIFAAIMGQIAAQKRIAELNALALANNLSFSPERDAFFGAQFPFFAALHRGHSQYAYNVLSGNYKGRGVTAFDYHYAVTTHTKNGTRTHHYHFSAVMVKVDFPLRELSIRPEGFLDKIGEFVGLDDIDFESSEFSRKFFVTAKEKKFAYGIVHQGMMEYLLAHPGYCLALNRNEILIYQHKTFKPEEFTKCLDLGIGFAEQIPPYLIEELKGSAL